MLTLLKDQKLDTKKTDATKITNHLKNTHTLAHNYLGHILFAFRSTMFLRSYSE